jgi:hypothetical protein
MGFKECVWRPLMTFVAMPIVSSASASALSGIRAASSRLNVGAGKLVSQTTLQHNDTVSVSEEGRVAAGSGSDDIAQGVVDLRLAKYQNAASIAVFRTADEMAQDLVNLGKRA